METELKFALPDAKTIAKIQMDSRINSLRPDQNWIALDMISWYMDTKDCWLARENAALRLRLEGSSRVLAIKQGKTGNGGVHQRQEWEADLPDDILPADFIARPGAILAYSFKNRKDSFELEKIIDYLAQHKLQIIGKIMFRREKSCLHYQDSVIELAFDMGYAECGSKRTNILEIELELLSGSLDTLLGIGNYLAENYHLLPESRSKLERCRELTAESGKRSG